MSLTEPLRIVSVSGGKDSTALYLWAMDRFGPSGFSAVMADTGHEHPVTMNYVRNLAEMSGGGPTVDIVHARFDDRLEKKGIEPSGSAFLDMMLWKGRAPSARAQFCTEHVKMRPIREWLEDKHREREVVMYVGIRAGESARRAKMVESEWSSFYDCQLERPLLRWSEPQVFEFLKAKGVPPNPLYDAGYRRVGCYPCIHAGKIELARLEDWAWDKLAEWERRLGRSWFSAGDIPGVFIPTIQDAREWARTSRGGRQFDMFAPEASDVPSCMGTWGVCE